MHALLEDFDGALLQFQSHLQGRSLTDHELAVARYLLLRRDLLPPLLLHNDLGLGLKLHEQLPDLLVHLSQLNEVLLDPALDALLGLFNLANELCRLLDQGLNCDLEAGLAFLTTLEGAEGSGRDDLVMRGRRRRQGVNYLRGQA